MQTPSDVTMPSLNFLEIENTSNLHGIGDNVLGLKILGRVILSCQFKSGPGHQTNPELSFENLAKSLSHASLRHCALLRFSGDLSLNCQDIARHRRTLTAVTMPTPEEIKNAGLCLESEQITP